MVFYPLLNIYTTFIDGCRSGIAVREITDS